MAHYFLILDITDWPINGVLWMKPFYTSEMHGQKSWWRQRLPIWVCEVERWKILERMRVSWVRSTARQVGVQSGDRAEQQGTSGGKIKIVLISLPPYFPPHQPPALSCSCRSWCHHGWCHTNLTTEEVKNTNDCCPCWRLAMFRVISGVFLNLKGSK